MINLARQAFANPFQSTVGSSLQPGAVGSVGRCPVCGNAVSIGSTLQPQTAGFNPVGFGGALSQQFGSVPTPYAVSHGTGFGQINPLAAQLSGGFIPGINPMTAQAGTNWPVSTQLAQQGIGGQTGAYGIDPRTAFGTGQQFGYNQPNVVPGLNPAIGGDPISALLSQQWNQLAQQQLPIRSLIAGQQGLGSQSFVRIRVPNSVGGPAQGVEPSCFQLANNAHQLRAYGGVPEMTGLGVPFVGQQFNPLFANVPFYG
jgi:hypothetical protein